MTLSEKDIRHIASLARLELTDKEIKQYRTELGGILRYVDQLKNVRIRNVSSTISEISTNILRDDTVQTWPEDERELALSEAPDQKAGLIKVKRILN